MASDHLWERLESLVRRGAEAADRIEADEAGVARAIAGCEYELRCLERDISQTRQPDGSGAQVTRQAEPFVIDGRLRDPARRRHGAWWQALGLTP